MNKVCKKFQRERIFVILSRLEKPENLGLIARSMKNTGFENLRLVKLTHIDPKSYLTAVHSENVLERAIFYPDLSAATADLDLIFASTSKHRKNFYSLSFKDALDKMFHYPSSTKIGLLFGNERTGLTSEEMKSSNFRFTIPQATFQPSYNLASAVLITLFQIYIRDFNEDLVNQERPLPRGKQEECVRLILDKLEKKKFIHRTNRIHMTQMIYDLFGKLCLTAKDSDLLLALFSKGIN